MLGNTPICCKLCQVNAKKREVMNQCFQELLNKGLIEPSTSPWASAPVLMSKKWGRCHLTMEYRGLNVNSRVLVYPMPRTDWLLVSLGRAQWFTSLDLSHGFFQIQVVLKNVVKTAFSCRQRTLQFKQMQLDLGGALATFKIPVDKILQGIKHKYRVCTILMCAFFSENKCSKIFELYNWTRNSKTSNWNKTRASDSKTKIKQLNEWWPATLPSISASCHIQ